MKTKQTIGPCMEAVRDFVREHPGCPKIAPARKVGPNGSLRYGYRAVDRAIQAGLIQATRREDGRYELQVAS